MRVSDEDRSPVRINGWLPLLMRSNAILCSLVIALANTTRVLNALSRLFTLSLAVALGGCATADFTPYVGAQQNWPTSSGAFVQTIEAGNGPMSEGGRYKLPVYFGPPNRPYRVIGYLDAESGSLAIWQSGKTESLRPAVKVAARHGADALILVAQGIETRGSSTASFGNFSSNTSLFGANYGNGIFSGNANTTGSFSGSSFTAPNRRGKARVIAIKFL